MKLLHIDSSILGLNSVSRTLSAEIVSVEQYRYPDIEVVYRDLATQPIGHLSGAHLAAAQGAVPETAELQQDIDQGAAILDEFLAADIIVIGAPMYNFSVPSQLKAWIDRIAVAGKTFRYTPNGAEGLAGEKKVVVASSRGGFYGPDTVAAPLDHQESYLRGVFGFLGIKDVTFVRAEGVALGEEQRTQSMEAAKAEICELAAAA
ncbi:MAG TPA: FMN-dependent NADH-azoreductase [Pyrinomonadaceae bacterium]|nr:FMN-dependent NADH-azoreductase [Pyrinomonadaceae bacterium]